MPRNVTVVWDSGPVITGQQLRDARSRAHMTQTELAQLLRHGLRTIQDWEREGVTEGKEPLVRAALGNYLETLGESPPLESYSDWALVSEIMRRLEIRAAELSSRRVAPGEPDRTTKTGRGARKTDDEE